MSFLAGRLRPIAVAAPSSHSYRAYSSFFSSKSGGGGRHFTSQKTTHKAVVATGTKLSKVVGGGSSASTGGVGKDAATQEGDVSAGSASASASSVPSSTTAAAASVSEDNTSDNTNTTTNSTSPSPSPPIATSPNPAHNRPQPPSLPDFPGRAPRYHPTVDTKGFKLLQFFSSHRPLLLLNQPGDIFYSHPAGTPLTLMRSSSQHEQLAEGELRVPNAPPTPGNAKIDDPLEADAEAARQLSRALTLNHAGAALAWEETMQRLGLQNPHGDDKVGLKARMDKEWEDVLIEMDSTKRKRRKKMKKHKLKKRRKATRASRLKIGR